MKADNITRCANCNTDLSTCNTVWAAQGLLYCSRECGISDFRKILAPTVVSFFDMISEEVSTIDIGLKEANTLMEETDDEKQNDA